MPWGFEGSRSCFVCRRILSSGEGLCVHLQSHSPGYPLQPGGSQISNSSVVLTWEACSTVSTCFLIPGRLFISARESSRCFRDAPGGSAVRGEPSGLGGLFRTGVTEGLSGLARHVSRSRRHSILRLKDASVDRGCGAWREPFFDRFRWISGWATGREA